HPNIAAIYGFEDSGATHALVMELVEGPTLAERISGSAAGTSHTPAGLPGPSATGAQSARKPGAARAETGRAIPVDEALRIAKQICEALEYAHERGIVHRDLKPANVKLTLDDAVKVLDFGLAKAIEGDASSMDMANSPTLTRMATMQGVLLGTAAYMSPEQAKAKPVDRRADIWAFGCVLYEMLTGKTAFQGETVTDTLAAVIKEEPDWTLLPRNTPLRVRVLLQRCLQKDPKQRLRDIGDARISLDEAISGAPLEAPMPNELGWARTGRRQTVLWTIACLAIAAIAGLIGWILKPAPLRPVTRAVINLPTGRQLAGLDGQALAFSADGSELAYVATTQGRASTQIYLRPMDSIDARPIPGTEGGSNPFFSPDGKWLGFFAGKKLKKISVSGGAAQDLADVSIPLGASWSSQGTIAFADFFAGFLEVPDMGGAPKLVSRGDINHGWPEFLPSGKAMLFAASSETADWTNSRVGVRLLKPDEQRDLPLGQAGTMPRYARPGYLIFAEGGNLMAAPFDPERLRVKGAAVPVVQGVLQSPTTGSAQYAISATGSLAYVPGSIQAEQSEMVWVSRNGTEQPLAAPARAYYNPRLSPDGRQVAVNITGRESQIWLYDLARETLTPFTFNGTSNQFPTWTPDGKRIAFRSNRKGPSGIFWKLADGTGGAERLSPGDNDGVSAQTPNSWSPNGQALAFMSPAPAIGQDIWILRMSDHKEQPYVETGTVTGAPEFSPDGRWLVYVSDESGRREVYVQSYPGPGGKWQVSTGGGTEPVWNRNGRELFYRSGDKMMAVEVATEPSFSAGKPRMLFEGSYEQTPVTFPNYDVSPDGQRFLMLKAVAQDQTAPTQINIVLNWTEELKRLIPAGSR
ncbi:MAG: protein kinase, partial [Candidatus Acidiferrales bacterium]